MALVGFMQAGNATVYAGSWRHPATEHGFLTAGYYEKLARTLEQGCFDLMFFDDRLAMPGIYGGSVAEAVRTGARPVKLDLSIVLGICAAVTSRIGLGATYSTTYYTPFHVARTFATLDHLSGGRAAWNVVTSVNDSEAQNYGLKEAIPHDARYDRADEFLEATTGLWDTWEDDALVLDRETPLFADPAKVHELNHDGEWFSVRGPLTVPRCPQGRPVLLQAGSSGRGREFAARWAELIFTGDPGIDIARSHYKDQKEKIGERGRDPDSVKMLPMAYTVVGESKAHAEEREQMFLNDLVDPMASLTLLSELMNYDFAGLDLDAPITDELIESVSGIRGLVQNIKTAHRRRHRDARRPGGAPGHAVAGPALRRHRPGHRRPDGGVVRQRRLRRLRHRGHAQPRRLRGRGPPRRARAAAPRRVPRPLRGHDAARAPRARTPGGGAWVPEPRPPAPGHPRHRRGHPGGRADGRHDARRVRRRGDQGRTARGGRPVAHLGRPEGRRRPVLEEHEPQQAVRHARPATSRRPGAVPPPARRERRLRGEQPAERAGQVGPRLRVGARRASPGRDAARERVRAGRARRATGPASAPWPRR